MGVMDAVQRKKMLSKKEILLTVFLVSGVSLLLGSVIGYAVGIRHEKVKICTNISVRAQEVRSRDKVVMAYPLKQKEGAIFGVLNIQSLICE